MAEMHGHFYSRADEELWVHHYGGSVFDDGSLKLTQTTHYPWDGAITLEIQASPSEPMALKLRIPGWCSAAEVSVNGVDAGPCPSGSYISLQRPWLSGDRVELTLEMPAVLIRAHHKLEQARGQAAVMRGPIVYCLESPDLPEGTGVFDVALPEDIELQPEHRPDLLGGLTILTGRAVRRPAVQKELYRPLVPGGRQPVEITLIPYYAWANRGVSQMSIWLPAI
jgi:DUF1680 family protein